MVSVQLPGGLHLLNIAGTARCDNSDIVKGVRSPGSFASSYLHFTHASSLRAARNGVDGADSSTRKWSDACNGKMCRRRPIG